MDDDVIKLGLLGRFANNGTAKFPALSSTPLDFDPQRTLLDLGHQ